MLSPVYTVYIKNYTASNGAVQTTETKLYSVPVVDDAYAVNALVDPVVKAEMGKAGTFEFTVYPDHPYYSCWNQMRTIMRVEYNGVTIFRGRVLTIDVTLYGEKKIHCEGDFAFLMDSVQTGVREEERSSITCLAYLTNLINAHNSQMDLNPSGYQDDHKFALGNVPGQYANTITDAQQVIVDQSKKYGSDSWETTMSALEELQSDYGGYFRTRYSNGTVYLDWLDSYYSSSENSQLIEVCDNLIDLQTSTEVDNIFTVLVPIGKNEGKDVYISGYNTSVHGNNNYIRVPDIVSQYTDAQLSKGYHKKSDYENAINKYGIVYKIQSFPNANTQEKLWSYACDYILNNYIGSLTGFDATALDMHHADGTIPALYCGDRVQVKYRETGLDGTTTSVTKSLTASCITYNLHNPESNAYTMGIPNNILNKTYGVAVKSNKATAAAKATTSRGGGGGGGRAGKKQQEEEDILKAMDEDKSELGLLAWEYIINAKYHNEEYQQLLQDDPDLRYAPTVLRTGKSLVKQALDPGPNFADKLVNSIILSGGKIEMNADLNKIGIVNPTFKQAGKTVTSLVIDAYESNIEFKQKYVAQNFGPITPAITNPLKTTMMLSSNDNAAKFQTWKEGHLAQDTNPVLSSMLDGSDGTIASIISKLGLDGSGEKATIIQSGLTSMLQFFNPTSAQTTSPTETAQINGTDGTGKVGKDGSNNWQVKLNETVTYTDESGTSQTAAGFVSAKDFNIPSVASFKTKLIVVDNVVAGKATIGQLEAAEARITTLETTTLKTTELYAAIANLNLVSVHQLAASSSIGCTGPISGSTLSYGGNDVATVISGIHSRLNALESFMNGLSAHSATFVTGVSFANETYWTGSITYLA